MLIFNIVITSLLTIFLFITILYFLNPPQYNNHFKFKGLYILIVFVFMVIFIFSGFYGIYGFIETLWNISSSSDANSAVLSCSVLVSPVLAVIFIDKVDKYYRNIDELRLKDAFEEMRKRLLYGGKEQLSVKYNECQDFIDTFERDMYLISKIKKKDFDSYEFNEKMRLQQRIFEFDEKSWLSHLKYGLRSEQRIELVKRLQDEIGIIKRNK